MQAKSPLIILLMLLFFICIGSKRAVTANEFTNDLGLWTAINLNAPFTEKIQSKFQFSPRWLEDTTKFSQYITHALLGYKFNDHFILFQGYAWNTTFLDGSKSEHRPYQELNIYHNLKKASLEHRFRFEERFLEGVDNVSLRARYRLKGSLSLDKSEKWSLVLFDELFVNLYTLSNGPRGGIDQNRVYGGINYKLTENISTELGYQLQHLNRFSFDTLNHFIVFYLNFNLPVLANIKNNI